MFPCPPSVTEEAVPDVHLFVGGVAQKLKPLSLQHTPSVTCTAEHDTFVHPNVPLHDHVKFAPTHASVTVVAIHCVHLVDVGLAQRFVPFALPQVPFLGVLSTSARVLSNCGTVVIVSPINTSAFALFVYASNQKSHANVGLFARIVPL